MSIFVMQNKLTNNYSKLTFRYNVSKLMLHFSGGSRRFNKNNNIAIPLHQYTHTQLIY